MSKNETRELVTNVTTAYKLLLKASSVDDWGHSLDPFLKGGSKSQLPPLEGVGGGI